MSEREGLSVSAPRYGRREKLQFAGRRREVGAGLEVVGIGSRCGERERLNDVLGPGRRGGGAVDLVGRLVGQGAVGEGCVHRRIALADGPAAGRQAICGDGGAVRVGIRRGDLTGEHQHGAGRSSHVVRRAGCGTDGQSDLRCAARRVDLDGLAEGRGHLDGVAEQILRIRTRVGDQGHPGDARCRVHRRPASGGRPETRSVVVACPHLDFMLHGRWEAGDGSDESGAFVVPVIEVVRAADYAVTQIVVPHQRAVRIRLRPMDGQTVGARGRDVWRGRPGGGLGDVRHRDGDDLVDRQRAGADATGGCHDDYVRVVQRRVERIGAPDVRRSFEVRCAYEA